MMRPLSCREEHHLDRLLLMRLREVEITLHQKSKPLHGIAQNLATPESIHRINSFKTIINRRIEKIRRSPRPTLLDWKVFRNSLKEALSPFHQADPITSTVDRGFEESNRPQNSMVSNGQLPFQLPIKKESDEDVNSTIERPEITMRNNGTSEFFGRRQVVDVQFFGEKAMALVLTTNGRNWVDIEQLSDTILFTYLKSLESMLQDDSLKPFAQNKLRSLSALQSPLQQRLNLATSSDEKQAMKDLKQRGLCSKGYSKSKKSTQSLLKSAVSDPKTSIRRTRNSIWAFTEHTQKKSKQRMTAKVIKNVELNELQKRTIESLENFLKMNRGNRIPVKILTDFLSRLMTEVNCYDVEVPLSALTVDSR